MKKIALFSIAVLMCMIGIMVVYAKPEGSETLYENLTTKNFLKKMKDINYQEIKGLCVYDFCDYMVGESLEEGLDNFTKSYLKTIEDEEVRASLRIMGFRITEVITQN